MFSAKLTAKASALTVCATLLAVLPAATTLSAGTITTGSHATAIAIHEDDTPWG